MKIVKSVVVQRNERMLNRDAAIFLREGTSLYKLTSLEPTMELESL